jgi:hypothetical protein
MAGDPAAHYSRSKDCHFPDSSLAVVGGVHIVLLRK